MKSGNVFFRAMLALWMTLSAAAQAETIVLAVPGPGSLAFLPVYLAKAIEADHEQGLELKHLHRQIAGYGMRRGRSRGRTQRRPAGLDGCGSIAGLSFRQTHAH